jgi:hypothetical protein
VSPKLALGEIRFALAVAVELEVVRFVVVEGSTERGLDKEGLDWSFTVIGEIDGGLKARGGSSEK